ncbi:dTMP kinase, partial [Ferroplasma sp.]|uniref:dTMP kinase n=1 Tax=Ferroplasma sp. TaxID=2591003 RepID=UPI00307F02AE
MFITVEGIDGSGKTTLVNSLKAKLDMFHFTREPTDKFEFAKLKTLSNQYNSFYNFFLFTYDRLEHQEEINQYEYVLCDRYIVSSIAYEGPMLEKFFGSKEETIKWMMNVSKMLKIPDAIIYLDVSLPVALKRIKDGRKGLNFRGKQLSKLEDPDNLDTIKKYYDYFFDRIDIFVQKEVKILKIDANQSQSNVISSAEEMIK